MKKDSEQRPEKGNISITVAAAQGSDSGDGLQVGKQKSTDC